MTKTIICSVGTSASKNLNIRPKDLETWVNNQQGSLETAAQEMFKSFIDFEPTDENLRDHLSAEIHSLVRIGIDTGDRVLLFGHLCVWST